MSIGETLATEGKGLVNFGFILGLGLIMLGKFSTVSGVVCTSLYDYNASANLCQLTSNTSVTTAVSVPSSTIQSIVSSLGDFVDWIGIIILVIVGVLLMAKWNKKKGGF